jgi:hypothetical protein
MPLVDTCYVSNELIVSHLTLHPVTSPAASNNIALYVPGVIVLPVDSAVPKFVAGLLSTLYIRGWGITILTVVLDNRCELTLRQVELYYPVLTTTSAILIVVVNVVYA